MNWPLQVIATLPNALWLLGTKWAGDRRRLGWAILFASEGAWLWFALATGLWAMLPWVAAGFVMYWRNYRKWRADSTA